MPGTLRVVAGPTCETLRSSVQWLISQDVCQQCRQCQLRPCVPPTSTRGALRANRKAWVAASRVAAAVSTRWLLDQTGASCTAGQSGKVWRVSRASVGCVQAKSTWWGAASSMRKSICAMFATLITSLIETTRTRCGLNCERRFEENALEGPSAEWCTQMVRRRVAGGAHKDRSPWTATGAKRSLNPDHQDALWS